MPLSSNVDPEKHIKSRRNKVAVSTAVLICFTIIIFAVISPPFDNTDSPIVVLRVDDIQDFAFKDAQLFLLNYSSKNNLPLSLGIIAGFFGADNEIVNAVKTAVISGSEINVHGWEHENFVERSLIEQMKILFQAKNRLKEVLDVNTVTVTPPGFGFNNATIVAMEEEGLNIISSSSDLYEADFVSPVISIPATVELSNYTNGIWQMKGISSINAEVSRSIQVQGYAIIVTHPQEFYKNGKLDQASIMSYTNLIQILQKGYSFKTLKELVEIRMNHN